MKKLILAKDHALDMKKVAIITDGERQIVAEMAAGKSAEDIAKALNRSLYTVQNRIYTLRKKTGYRKNTFLVAAFKDQGLIWELFFYSLGLGGDIWYIFVLDKDFGKNELKNYRGFYPGFLFLVMFWSGPEQTGNLETLYR